MKANYRSEINIFKRLILFLHKHRVIHFLLVGIFSAFIQIVSTYLFVEFIFGLENYFYGYLLGLLIGITTNFMYNSKYTFRVVNNNFRKFIVFNVYMFFSILIQLSLVKIITPIVGLEYYLFVVVFVLVLMSSVNFICYKLWIFKE